MLQIIIPNVIDGGGTMTLKESLSLLIFFNLVFISIYLIRCLIWKFSKSKETFFKYVIYDNSLDKNFITYLNTVFFLIINGLALSTILIIFIESLL